MVSNIVRRSLLACALIAAAPVAMAANEAKPAKAANTTAAASPEAAVRTAVEGMINPQIKIQSITKTTYGNLYEVVLDQGDILYADASGAFFLSGSLYDLKTRRDVTQARISQLSRINIADLPLNNAVKQVRGNGKRVLVTFEDPNCGYCKKLAKDLTEVKDATVYTFMVPILSPDSTEKSRNIWCAKDRMKAWNDWMTEGKVPEKAECDTPIAKNSELAKKLRVTGTPTIYLADGNRQGGYVPPQELDRLMGEADKSKDKYVAKK